jgi:hypothetical protein
MLNISLYTALCRVFGSRNVRVIKQGQQGKFEFGLRQRVVKGLVEDYRTICKKHTNSGAVFVGEEFKVPCPFCKDHLPRLYINHLFGTKDKVTGQRFLWLANCYNEGCMSSFANRKKLFEMLADQEDISHLLGKSRSVNIAAAADWPGEVWSIYDLAKKDPKHPAVWYAYARSWDIQQLASQFDVRVIIQAAYLDKWLNSRVIAPVYGKDRMLKTWTARKVLSSDEGPKWLHCPHIGTSSVIYGLATARKCRVPGIVEGPGDSWGRRGEAAGIFGKALQEGKAKRLAEAFSDAQAIALMLDPNQDYRERMENKPHHMDIAAEMLSKFTDVPVIKVWLPEDTDPGSLDYDVSQWHIERCADEQGIAI